MSDLRCDFCNTPLRLGETQAICMSCCERTVEEERLEAGRTADLLASGEALREDYKLRWTLAQGELATPDCASGERR